MSFISITDSDKIEILATNIVRREQEVHQYQINIDNYTMMLMALPQDEWPSDIQQYKTATPENIPHDLNFETVQLIVDYQYRDRLRFLLRTENIEQSKSKRVLDALKQQIPSDQLESLVLSAKAKIDSMSQ
jgi:hypothetical protein